MRRASALTPLTAVLLLGGCALTPRLIPPTLTVVDVQLQGSDLWEQHLKVRMHVQNPNDRARTEAAAKAQCKQPYVIGAGTSGGVIMHLADQATPQELRLKGSQTGKNYIGPPGPAGGEQDREIVSFDGRVLITRFIEKDAATRYGNMVYVRCAPRA